MSAHQVLGPATLSVRGSGSKMTAYEASSVQFRDGFVFAVVTTKAQRRVLRMAWPATEVRSCRFHDSEAARSPTCSRWDASCDRATLTVRGSGSKMTAYEASSVQFRDGFVFAVVTTKAQRRVLRMAWPATEVRSCRFHDGASDAADESEQAQGVEL